MQDMGGCSFLPTREHMLMIDLDYSNTHFFSNQCCYNYYITQAQSAFPRKLGTRPGIYMYMYILCRPTCSGSGSCSGVAHVVEWLM